jgi:hypothetical protein
MRALIAVLFSIAIAACAQSGVKYSYDGTSLAPFSCRKALSIAPKLEIFTWSRQKWARPLDLPQFDHRPS